MLLNRNTFDHSADVNDPHLGAYKMGMVEVTLQGKIRQVPCKLFDDGWMIATGMVGRYHTSAKQWDALIWSRPMPDGSIREHVRFGRDDNHPKFRKENCIFFK